MQIPNKLFESVNPKTFSYLIHMFIVQNSLPDSQNYITIYVHRDDCKVMKFHALVLEIEQLSAECNINEPTIG